MTTSLGSQGLHRVRSEGRVRLLRRRDGPGGGESPPQHGDLARRAASLNLYPAPPPPKVLDATNTTPDRRDLILSFAKDNGYKVGLRSQTIPAAWFWFWGGGEAFV